MCRRCKLAKPQMHNPTYMHVDHYQLYEWKTFMSVCRTFKLAKPQSVLSQIQAEEERVLMAAIQDQKLNRIGAGPA